MAKNERFWKPVDLSRKGRSKNATMTSGGAMATQHHSVNWYNKIMQHPQRRKDKLRRYDMMDQTVDISRALDIMAEDISSDNADNEDTFILDFPENNSVKKTIVKQVEEFKDKWKKRTEFDVEFFNYVREMLKYGAVFFEKNEDHTLTKLVPQRIEGYVLDPQNDQNVIAYLYNDEGIYKNENEDDVGAHAAGKTRTIPVSRMLILKIGNGPYGQSILDPVYRTWRHIQLIEDAIIIYRIVRAPERRVFYIDTGRQPQPKAEAYLRKLKNAMRQRQLVKSNGELETEYNPASMQEDYFIAQSGEGRGSRVETLPGGQNLDQIRDLLYYNKKLQHGLRIPSGYMESAYDENGRETQNNDGRVGTAYISELRYAGHIIRIQRRIAKPLFDHFKSYLRARGIELPDTVGFRLAEPQSFAIYKENELFSTLLNTVHSASNVEGLSKRYSLIKFLHMSAEDLADNEMMKLIEMGIPEEAIKELSDTQCQAIVYGGQTIDRIAPEIATKYNLLPPADEEGAGYGF